MSSKVAPLAAVDAAAAEVIDQIPREAVPYTPDNEIFNDKEMNLVIAAAAPGAAASQGEGSAPITAEPAGVRSPKHAGDSCEPRASSSSMPRTEKPRDHGADGASMDESAAPLVAAGAGDDALQRHERNLESGSSEDSEHGDNDESDDESSSDEDDSGSEYEVPVRTHGNWDAFVDEDTGTEYYYNRETGETTWDVPDPALAPPHLAALEFLNKLMTNPYDLEQPHPLSSHGEWSLYVDAESMAMYYCNDESGETSWEPPSEWNDKLASIPPLAVLTSQDGSGEGSLSALVAAKAGDKPSKPPEETSSTAREPCGPDSERIEAGAGDTAPPPLEPAKQGATAAAKPAGEVPDLEKGLESIDKAKVWFVYRDIENLMQYFVNAKTGASLWEPPLEIAEQVVEHEAASIQPGEWQLYINKEEEDGEPDDCVAIVKGWEVYQDRASGRWYYFDPNSGETQWDAPDAVLQAAPEDWEAGGASTDADGNVVNHGEDEAPAGDESDAEETDDELETHAIEHNAAEADSAEGQGESIATAHDDGLNQAQQRSDDVSTGEADGLCDAASGSDGKNEATAPAAEEATIHEQEAKSVPQIAQQSSPSHDVGVAAEAVAHALIQHQDSLKDEVEGSEWPTPHNVAPAMGDSPPTHSPVKPSAPIHLKSRPASKPQSKPPTRPPTAGKKKSKCVDPSAHIVWHSFYNRVCRKDKSDKKKKDKSKKKKDKSKKKKDKSKKKKKSKSAEAESDSDSDLGDLLGANAAYQHERPLAAGAAVQQTLDLSQRHRAPSNAGGATSVMDAIAMIQRAYGNQADSDDEDAEVTEGGEDAVEGAPAPPKEPVQKADESATYKIFMPPPPKPSGNTGLGFGLAMGVKSRFGKKPLAPGMDVEDPQEEERKRRETEQEAIRARILAAQEAKRRQEEEDAKLAELEGNDAASANALNLLASAAGLSATELAKMLERRKVDDPNNKGLLAWAKAFLQKTQKKAKTLESRLRLDSKIDDETKAKLKEEIQRLKLLCDKLREWEEEERKRRREMDEEMKAQLKAQAEADKARLADKRARIRADREAAKQRAADERKRKAEEARVAMQQRKAKDAELKAQREAAAAAELERKRALAASVKS